MKYRELNEKAKSIAKQYKKCEQELIAIIIKIDQCKLFYSLGYNSLFKYVVDELNLSESIAYNFINVARKSHQVPELKRAVCSGDVSVSKARKVVPVINRANQSHWLRIVKTQSQKQIERQVALANPKVAIPEKMTYQSPQMIVQEKVSLKTSTPRVHLSLGISEKLMIQLRRAQDLECQKARQNATLEETLEKVLEIYLNRMDPARKAVRQKLRGKLPIENCRKPQLVSDRSMIDPVVLVDKSLDESKQKNKNALEAKRDKKRRALPAQIKHQVQLRDGSRCTFVNPKGHRCSSRRFLEIHHILPLSKGGTDDLSNLTTFCSGHHKAIHKSHETG
jgi:hypothetical protein